MGLAPSVFRILAALRLEILFKALEVPSFANAQLTYTFSTVHDVAQSFAIIVSLTLRSGREGGFWNHDQ